VYIAILENRQQHTYNKIQDFKVFHLYVRPTVESAIYSNVISCNRCQMLAIIALNVPGLSLPVIELSADHVINLTLGGPGPLGSEAIQTIV
jgi:hypothetical protein